MENRDPLLTSHYAEKANHFLHGMRLLADDFTAYKTSIGLLAIHSAISLNDAILAGVTGARSKSEDHSAAARELERICDELKIEKLHGIHHLSSLLGQKSHIAYGDERVADSDVQSAISRAERFANWAYTHFKEVLGVRRS